MIRTPASTIDNHLTVSAPDGTTIAYSVAGKGPALVLTNGLTTTSFFWKYLRARHAVDGPVGPPDAAVAEHRTSAPAHRQGLRPGQEGGAGQGSLTDYVRPFLCRNSVSSTTDIRRSAKAVRLCRRATSSASDEATP